MIRIAFVGTRGILKRYSGIETALGEIAKRLARNDYRITVYCIKNKSTEAEKQIDKNIKLIFLPTIKTKYLSTLFHTISSTLHLLFSDVDIVHFHALGPSVFSFLPRIFGKKTIVTIHGLDWKRKKWNYFVRLFLRLCEYSAVFFPDRTIVISRTLKDYFEKKFKKKIYYISNGVDIPGGYIQEAAVLEKKYILFTGRLVPEKGIHYLINAFNEVKTGMKLIIAGEASFTEKYASYLHTIASGNIEFLGFVGSERLRDLYENAYLFVLPSEVEGSSVSLLEAMSYGRCVLVSDIPECLEIIDDCGFSFKSGDCLSLRDKLQYLIDSPQIVSAMGIRARQRVAEKYNWGCVINELKTLYASLNP